jgi:hypothetical protein
MIVDLTAGMDCFLPYTVMMAGGEVNVILTLQLMWVERPVG